jgi:regulator of sigma E protease
MEILVKVGQLLLSLSILVVLHELGHFLPAKFFKTKVEKFYLFFDPWFSLFKFKRGDTEYGIGWLPLGGYVKIAGMIDESMDKEQMKQAPQSWEFRSKPAWQRLIIMVGGVTVNVLLAMLIYAMLLYKHGEQFLPMQNATHGIWLQDSSAQQLGLQNGDKVLSVGDEEMTDFNGFNKAFIFAEGKQIVVDRNGDEVVLPIPEGSIGKIVKSQRMSLIAPRIPTEIKVLQDGGNAKKAGLLPGDRLISVAGESTPYFDQFRDALAAHKGESVSIGLIRDGQTLEIPADVTADGRLGFEVDMTLSNYFTISQKEYGFFASFPAGVNKAINTLGMYVSQIKLLFTSKEIKAKDSLGGFITIGKIFPSTWNWIDFWNLTALLSIVLAVMNILPIPALDGGHVLFLLYEMVVGRPPHEKFLYYAQMVGMALLLGLMLYVNGLDFLRLFGQ